MRSYEKWEVEDWKAITPLITIPRERSGWIWGQMFRKFNNEPVCGKKFGTQHRAQDVIQTRLQISNCLCIYFFSIVYWIEKIIILPLYTCMIFWGKKKGKKKLHAKNSQAHPFLCSVPLSIIIQCSQLMHSSATGYFS